MREAKQYEGVANNLFDTHAHLYDSRFIEEGVAPLDVLTRASRAGVSRILIPSDSLQSSIASIDYVKSFDGVEGVELFCSVGVHPHEASSWNLEVENRIIEFIANRSELKVRAIGEIGLDYYYDLSPRDVQKAVYKRQLELAYELDIPFILHERDAAGDSMEILRSFYKAGKLRKNPGVCHCCSCSPEIAKELVKMGFYLGFDGPITFKNNKNSPLVIENTPLDRLVIETDSPYLTPVPNRGILNEPGYVPFVLEKMAEIKNLTVEEMSLITTNNALDLYELK